MSGEGFSAQVEVQPHRPGRACRLESLGSLDLALTALRPSPVVERIQQTFELEVCERKYIAQAAGEQHLAVTDGGGAAHQLDAHLGERVEIERRPLWGPDELRGGEPPGPREVVDLVVALIPHARGVHPPENVTPPVGARQPHVLSNGEGDPPTRSMKLRCQLHAGGRRPHDEHAPSGELIRIAVVERRELLDVRRHRLGEAGNHRSVTGACRDYKCPTADLAVARRHVVAVADAAHRRDVRAGSEWRSDR